MAAVQSDDVVQQERHSQWYDPDITDAPGPIRHLLETYSHIPRDKVVEHINAIRKKAFAANPYPCIGTYRFLNLTLLTHPLYPEILKQLKADPQARYLDLGCCFGQDLRQLVADGCPSVQLTGLDIEGALMELGYDLFLDRETLASNFVVADIFKGVADQAWSRLLPENQGEPGFAIVHCSALLHLFPLPEQIRAAEQVARLVRVGGVIVGRQSGSVKPGEVSAIKAGTTSFRHDLKTFREMWDQVGEKTGTTWRVEGELDMVGMGQAAKDSKNGGNISINRRVGGSVEDENSRRLLFSVYREA